MTDEKLNMIKGTVKRMTINKLRDESRELANRYDSLKAKDKTSEKLKDMYTAWTLMRQEIATR